MLVGEGAKSYAMQQGIELCSVDELITGKWDGVTLREMLRCTCTDKAQAVYVDHMNRLERSGGPQTKKTRIDNPVCLLVTASV